MCITKPIYEALTPAPSNEIMQILMPFYSFSAILSTTYAWKTIFNSNFNVEVRSLFLRKQLAYVIAFSVFWQL